MTWLLVQCGEHWKGNRFTGPISFSVRLTKKYNGASDELVETIYQRTGVSRDKAELKLTSHVKTEDDTVTLSIMSDDDVEFMIIHKEKVWATIDVEFVNKHEFRPPANPIQSVCTVSPVKPIENPRSPSGTPNYKSVSGSNNPFASHASPGFTSATNDQATPVSTTKHAVVDDNDSSESSNTEDEGADDDCGQGATKDGTEEQGVSGTPNSSSPSMNTRWTVSGSELYSIKAVRSVDVFEKPADQERFEYRVSRSSNTRFTTECTQRSCGWVLRAWKSNRGTYWQLKSFVNEHTCDRNDNHNIEFKRVSVCVIGDLFASKFGDPRRIICPKDIVSEMREQQAYTSRTIKPTVTKIKTDSKNQFKYGFMAIGASIEGFNSVIRPVIYIDATHLKARTRGVLLVAVCKDGNEMIYPLAFGFANSECTESWTWFLKKLRKVIQYPDRVMLVSDRHNDATHGICAYHLAQNLKRFCKHRDDVIWLYYRATYAYRIEEFDRVMIRKLPITAMAEFIRDLLQRWFYNRRTNARQMSTYLTTFADEHIKDRIETAHRCKIHPIHFNTFKVDDKWKETTVDLDECSCSCRQWDLDELSCSHAMAVARFKGVSINALASDLYTTGFLKHAYEMGVNPVPDPEFWDIPDAILNRIVLPWKKKNLPGRPKKLRIPSVGEKRKLQSCSKCGKKDTIK
ncbi:hypothetical protein Dsin_002187 [Dipteronia sinensis]|uniref:SWIM-type domain-containing protein n=1 Tax=Dipteronia sinensis TaxID=43782 RepID=A0AAE0B5A9_9ROSI|nr:hypothetical protein Dsin_002187 [Dipteronia sinensis]